MPLSAIQEGHVDAIALGATVLGTGGGGDPRIGALIAKRMLRIHGPVNVLAVHDVSDDDFVVPVGVIGSPSVDIEKLMAETEIPDALDALEASVGRRATAIMPIEVGGGNSMVPLAAAAMRGLPLIDGDAMGRAFPEAPMVTFHLAGYGPGTTVLVDAFRNRVVSRPRDGDWSERISRALTVAFGGTATMIDYAFTGDVVRECAIPGTISTAHRVGTILLGAADEVASREADRIDAVCRELRGHRLFEGKVVALDRRVEGGFTRGRVELAGLGDDRGSVCHIDFQNELLHATRDDKTVAVTPDLIVLLDHDTGLPITTESLHYGLRAVALGIPCDDRWRTTAGLTTAGPAHFGFDVQWAPVETLARKES